jgi:predicted site-specific integrase-resolvase
MIGLKTAAQRFGISVDTLTRWTATRALPCQKVDRRIYIRPEDLTAVLKVSGRPVPKVVA